MDRHPHDGRCMYDFGGPKQCDQIASCCSVHTMKLAADFEEHSNAEHEEESRQGRAYAARWKALAKRLRWERNYRALHSRMNGAALVDENRRCIELKVENHHLRAERDRLREALEVTTKALSGAVKQLVSYWHALEELQRLRIALEDFRDWARDQAMAVNRSHGHLNHEDLAAEFVGAMDRARRALQGED